MTVALECLHGQLAEQLELSVESFVAIKVKLHLLNRKILLRREHYSILVLQSLLILSCSTFHCLIFLVLLVTTAIDNIQKVLLD